MTIEHKIITNITNIIIWNNILPKYKKKWEHSFRNILFIIIFFQTRIRLIVIEGHIERRFWIVVTRRLILRNIQTGTYADPLYTIA